MIKKYVFLVLLLPSILFAQEERYPIFDICKNSDIQLLKKCFYTATRKHFYVAYKKRSFDENKVKGTANIIFAVTSEGEFKLIHVQTPHKEIRETVKRVFNLFPKIIPASYDDHPIEMKFEFPIEFPVIKDSANFEMASHNKINKESLSAAVEKKKDIRSRLF